MAENGKNGDASAGKIGAKYTTNFDLNEISLLRNKEPEHSDSIPTKSDDDDPNSLQEVNVTTTDTADTATVLSSKKKNQNKFKGTYESLMTQLDLSKKARIPFLIACTLCAILLIVVIALIACWPRIPYHMTADVCVDKECLDSSAQILRWANTSKTPCDDPYSWACGKFEEEYLQHEFYGMNGGEWNQDAYEEYDEMKKVHEFIAQLPTTSAKPQLMIKLLHSSCMSLETETVQDTQLKTIIHALSGWVYLPNFSQNEWEFKKAMVHVQSQYGVFPFFKYSIENRNSPPFGNVVHISEGELGLPHKFFYNLSEDHTIIKAYKMLLRDFAIHLGVVSEAARKFADEIFYFERRIVNAIPLEKRMEYITLADLQKKAISLPIVESIQTTFSKTNLDEETLVLVSDVQTITEMSIIVSTTDVSPLNSFVIWSLSRQFLPFMSRPYRAALEEFQRTLYGIHKTSPQWYFCSKVIKNWVPFALYGLQKNPELIVRDSEKSKSLSSQSDKTYFSDSLVRDRQNLNEELLKIIFYHLRHEFKKAIDANVAITPDVTTFINNKLSEIKIQIGIPSDILKTTAYINNYYANFQWRKLNFMDNVESAWTLRKHHMEHQLNKANETDKIIAHLFPASKEEKKKLVRYSLDLNQILVTEEALRNRFYNYKYPIAVNFARIGVEMAKSLLEAVFLFGEQFKNEWYATKHINTTRTKFSLGDTACLEGKITDSINIPEDVKSHLYTHISSGRFTANSLNEFLSLVKNNQPIPDTLLPDGVTYSLLGLQTDKRQAGLRSLDDDQLFGLAFVQRHCASDRGLFTKYKPYFENELLERELFDISWNQIPQIAKSLGCRVTDKECENQL